MGINSENTLWGGESLGAKVVDGIRKIRVGGFWVGAMEPPSSSSWVSIRKIQYVSVWFTKGGSMAPTQNPPTLGCGN
jgi:hypothetical protein